MKSSQQETERQPLLTTVLIASERPRYPRARTFSRIVAIVLGSGLVYIAFSLFFPKWTPYGSNVVGCLSHTGWHGERVPLEMLEEIMLLTPQEEQARAHSEYYTSGPHLGGKNLSQAIYTRELWESYGIQSEIVTYDIYTNYPKSHRLGLLQAKSSNSTIGTSEIIDGRSYGLLYEAGLAEDVLQDDPTTGLDGRIPTFHGYSSNGNVTAEYIYANYGTFMDFEDLLFKGVNLTGKIVICKYGKIFRGLKVKRAQELGAIGILIYSDPGDDGPITELKGYKAYPDGPARNPSSVQRGSVQFLSYGPGDPTTPGYASKPGVPRKDPSAYIPSIPSLPISYLDALPLLQALNNYGINSSDLGERWNTGGLYHKNVTYHVGPAPGIVVNLVNQVEYMVAPMWDVIGKIPGYMEDQIILGNHRDAWIAGGASDPNSGSAALNELARSFGKMLEVGWKPARTLVLASWDGEEYGLLGSTEWAEDHQKLLSQKALAYINVDVGARSSKFSTAAHPLLQDVIHAATKKVVDPNCAQVGNFSTSVYDVWNKRIPTLGSGSDYTVFQDFLGIPSLDMGFSGQDAVSVYHYHSNYDSHAWMSRYGDPGFRYHVAIAKIWGLIALQLSESPVVPFNATSYTTGLGEYLAHIQSGLNASSSDYSPHHPHHPHPPADEKEFLHHLSQLQHSIHRLQVRAKEFDARAAHLADELSKPAPWWRRIVLWWRARTVNQQYKFFDRAFLYKRGLDDRPWFQHLVYAPGKWTGYSGDTFPGLVESVSEKNWTNAVRWSEIIRHSVELATKELHLHSLV